MNKGIEFRQPPASSVLWPVPESKPLQDGQTYYYPDLNCCDGTGCIKSTWRGDIVDFRRLRAGIVHLDEWSAKAHRDAIIIARGGALYERTI